MRSTGWVGVLVSIAAVGCPESTTVGPLATPPYCVTAEPTSPPFGEAGLDRLKPLLLLGAEVEFAMDGGVERAMLGPPGKEGKAQKDAAGAGGEGDERRHDDRAPDPHHARQSESNIGGANGASVDTIRADVEPTDAAATPSPASRPAS